TPNQTFGTINNNLTISERAVGHYVFNISTINLAGGKTLTLSAPSGSTFILNISTGMTFSPGSVVESSGGMGAADVLLNYTGTADSHFSGGGNASQVFGTILAPNALVAIDPGFVNGSVIASEISM